MISSWLLPSRVAVQRPSAGNVDGILTSTFSTVPGYENVPARLEVSFLRPGKDFPLPTQAGRAPDRVAVYWVGLDVRLQAGDRLVCVSGPVSGVWEVRVAPDPAQGMMRSHHQEGQCVEVHASTQGEVR